ncbi:MinD/ParA family ATP-binding protein [Paraburkholderia tropica]|uniref:MinD/ParA family ATP-binding protein n=1 Tax=Paraburkholderia tropica TaxID=92647 RepID=UPI002AB21D55|nr:AAA family ATPase [Paraburkholderia tropica]
MASAKGGSGKTSLTATLGAFLSQLNKKVLVVDADSATNGLTLLYIKEVRVTAELVRSSARKPSGLFDAISTGRTCDVVELGPQFHMIPASYSLQVADLVPGESTLEKFRSLIGSYRNEYDYILIDAQAGSDEVSTIVMSRRVSNEVVIVSEYDPMSAAGVERLKALLRDDLTYDRTWVLLNKMLPEFVKTFSDFLEVAKYLSPIPWDAEVVRAYARRRLAIDSETGNEYTLSIMQVLKGLCGDSIHGELNDWLNSRAAIIRQPIEMQYRDAEQELSYILLNKSRTARRNLMSRVMAGSLLSAGLAVGGFLIWRSGVSLNLWDGGHSSVIPIGVAVAATVVTMVAGMDLPRLIRTTGAKSGVESQLQEARFDRQLEVLQEKLKRLEVLRTLDPEGLLQYRSRSANDALAAADMKAKR